MNPEPTPPALPYRDRKNVGAADFYFAINATFRFIADKFGPDGLHRYWQELGTNYFAPVGQAWKSGGLPKVAEYWRAFFFAEPGAEVSINTHPESVVLEVRVCPAIKHLREHGRPIYPGFCQHCYYVSEAIAAPAGLTVRVAGGNGSCRQTFLARDSAPGPQDLTQIKEAT